MVTRRLDFGIVPDRERLAPRGYAPAILHPQKDGASDPAGSESGSFASDRAGSAAQTMQRGECLVESTRSFEKGRRHGHQNRDEADDSVKRSQARAAR